MNDYFRVGVFTSTHGIKGEIKVFPTTDDIKRFDDLKKVVLDTKEGLVDLEVCGVKYFKNMAILKFKNIDRIEDIEKYKGCDLLVTREDAAPLGTDEYYIADLIGLKVITDFDTELGCVFNVLQTGANDVYVVRGEDNKEILIPVIKDCVKEVNINEGYIKVHLIDGLLDI